MQYQHACKNTLYQIFHDAGTHQSIQVVMNHPDTQYIMIDHVTGITLTLLACIFLSFNPNCGSTFIQYMVILLSDKHLTYHLLY